MKKSIKTLISLGLNLFIVSCSNSPIQLNKNIELETTKKVEDKNDKVETNVIKIQEDKNQVIYPVTNNEKGANISFKVNFSKNNSFSTKDNQDGVIEKTYLDIASYDVYLVKATSPEGYLTGDPLGVDLFAGPINVLGNGQESKLVTLSKVPSSGTDSYYVALKAKDSLGNNITKVNNGWTGVTAGSPHNGQLAVSSGFGINVDSDLIVSLTTPLNLTINLLNAKGAKLETNVSVVDGNVLGSLTSNSSIKPKNEFRVNTYTTGVQQGTSTAMDSLGNFVITWSSYSQDGSGYGVYAQRYNAIGTPQGSEFLVNNYTTGNQSTSSVAMSSNGNFVITWQSDNQASGSSLNDIYAKRYDSNGVAQGTEFLVNSYTTNQQTAPEVAIDSNGNFVVVWQSYSQDGSGYGIYGRRYKSSGSVEGIEFQINTYTTIQQGNPSVAIDFSGNFVVAWNSLNQDNSSFGIYGQRYNSSGVVQGSEFQINTYTTSGQIAPSLAMDNSGNFVVTWNSLNQDTSSFGIYGQRYNSSGVVQGSEFQINTYTTDSQALPTVAMNSTGDFVVTWNSLNNSVYGIYAQRYNSNGVSQGSEFLVNTYTTTNESSPSITINLAGDFVVTWTSGNQDGSGTGIYSQMFSRKGIKR